MLIVKTHPLPKLNPKLSLMTLYNWTFSSYRHENSCYCIHIWWDNFHMLSSEHLCMRMLTMNEFCVGGLHCHGSSWARRLRLLQLSCKFLMQITWSSLVSLKQTQSEILGISTHGMQLSRSTKTEASIYATVTHFAVSTSRINTSTWRKKFCFADLCHKHTFWSHCTIVSHRAKSISPKFTRSSTIVNTRN